MVLAFVFVLVERVLLLAGRFAPNVEKRLIFLVVVEAVCKVENAPAFSKTRSVVFSTAYMHMLYAMHVDHVDFVSQHHVCVLRHACQD